MDGTGLSNKRLACWKFACKFPETYDSGFEPSFKKPPVPVTLREFSEFR
jgi:hypothetical protein